MEDDPQAPELDQLAEWIRGLDTRSNPVKPGDLQRAHRIGFNHACRLLEALEARGDLERIAGPTMAWRPTPPPTKPGKGYALPLSTKEHAALLRGLEKLLAPLDGVPSSALQRDVRTLRAIRARLKRPA